MTEENIRHKILDKYQKLFEKHNLGIEYVYFFIELFDIDPCKPTTIIKVLEMLVEEHEKIVVPKPIKEIRRVDRSRKDFTRMRRRPKNETIKIYKNHTENEVEGLKEFLNAINYNFALLFGMLSITKLYLPQEINRQGSSEIKESKQKSKMKYGLLENIVTTTINSAAFKKSNIEKGETLNHKQRNDIYKLAQNLFPDEFINKKSFITKVKQKGYSKEQFNPRKSKNK